MKVPKVPNKVLQVISKQKIPKLSKYAASITAVELKIDPQTKRFLQTIHTTYDELQSARAAFELMEEQDLIASCIYQIEALEVKYNYLIKQARERGITHSDLLRQESDVSPYAALSQEAALTQT